MRFAAPLGITLAALMLGSLAPVQGGPVPEGVDLPVPPDAIGPPGNDMALLGVMGSQIWVSDWARPGLLFDLMILDPPVGELKVEWCSGLGWTSGVRTLMIEDYDEVAMMDDLPAHEGECYAISITDGGGHQQASTTRPVRLVGPDIAVDPNDPFELTYEDCGPDNDCLQLRSASCTNGFTTAAGKMTYQGAKPRTNGISTAAKWLSQAAYEDEWTYSGWRSQPLTFLGTYTAPDTSSWGMGWYGANKFPMGGYIDMAAAVSMEGSADHEQQYNSLCKGYATVGYIFTLRWPELFYEDVVGVVANHEKAWAKGRPSSTCTTPIPQVFSAALGLTKYGAVIEAALPDKFCVKDWDDIKKSNQKPGLGIKTSHSTSGDYAGDRKSVV